MVAAMGSQGQSESESSDSNATASNLPGPGRNVGLLYDYVGRKLESALKRRREPGSGAVHEENASHSTANSLVDTNATAPNLPGPGRNIGNLFDWLGVKIEAVANQKAVQLNLGPQAVAKTIRELCRHDERLFIDRHRSPTQLSKSQTKRLRKLCKKLVKYTRSHILDVEMQAFEEIISLSVEEPLVREVLAGSNVYYRLEPKFKEPNLILSSSKALGCLRRSEIHHLWSDLIACEGRNIGLDIFNNGTSTLLFDQGSVGKQLVSTFRCVDF
ncbi:hypothetical protein SCHPADRAFT_738248 [Schizopora paradoxa]|uniref:Uncharacterized protein n=1 Tax=Schizopora paradoxa TaxID=27342 RepID=A0A0H2QZX9_9AGAM|nr:hypothetical protein SCHPADRAFT_738248 [Schizopora paradoxa]